jgi:glycosyltransferase involved in cell wall biosynthesis
MGSGTRLKILEAMAARCAVVATSAAVAGLDAEARAAIVIADTEATFAEGVIRLLADEKKRATLGEKAQAVVRERYDWSALIPCLIDIYRKLGLE